jgi:hypothetical protein
MSLQVVNSSPENSKRKAIKWRKVTFLSLPQNEEFVSSIANTGNAESTAKYG